MSDRMPEDFPVTKCIDVMVGITRSKVFFCKSRGATLEDFLVPLGLPSSGRFLHTVSSDHLTSPQPVPMRFHRAPASAARLLTCGAHAGRPVPADRILREFDANQKHWYQNKIPQSLSSDATTAVLKNKHSQDTANIRVFTNSEGSSLCSKYVQEYVLQSFWVYKFKIHCLWCGLDSIMHLPCLRAESEWHCPSAIWGCPVCLNKVKHGMDHQMKALQKSWAQKIHFRVSALVLCMSPSTCAQRCFVLVFLVVGLKLRESTYPNNPA